MRRNSHRFLGVFSVRRSSNPRQQGRSGTEKPSFKSLVLITLFFQAHPFGEHLDVKPATCTSRMRLGEEVGVAALFAPSVLVITLVGACDF